MSAPSHVPGRVGPRVYTSPPRRPDSWTADRPGEVVGADQPEGGALGWQGPDQGYVLKLFRARQDRIVLGEGENLDDVVAGCAAVALKRASLFTRAPVIHDVDAALKAFGFLTQPDPARLPARRELFAELSHGHHYSRVRRVTALVDDEVLLQPPDRIRAVDLSSAST